jgi:hypothetical protein
MLSDTASDGETVEVRITISKSDNLDICIHDWRAIMSPRHLASAGIPRGCVHAPSATNDLYESVRTPYIKYSITHNTLLASKRACQAAGGMPQVRSVKTCQVSDCPDIVTTYIGRNNRTATSHASVVAGCRTACQKPVIDVWRLLHRPSQTRPDERPERNNNMTG